MPGRAPYPWEVFVPDDVPTTDGGTDGVARTDAGTPIQPAAFTELLVRLRDDYGDMPILITENGCVFADSCTTRAASASSRSTSPPCTPRSSRACPCSATATGRSSTTSSGRSATTQRFGLVHVDYDTQRRTIKDSGRYYARVIAANALVPAEVPVP